METTSPLRSYLLIYAILVVLALISVAVAYLDLGSLAIVVAMSIAAVKAALIVLYYMHVRGNTPLIRLAAAAAFFWLAIMFGLALTDYAFRFPGPPVY